MNTLVIHPKDITTDFLTEIYLNKNWDVINTNVPPHQLKEQIQKYDRIIMLGHGIPQGLLGFGRLIIDTTFIPLLKEKINNVYIWCNADQFVKANGLKGFATGMIISEVGEALYFGILPEKGEIEVSNKLFAEAIKNSIELVPNKMVNEVMYDYKHYNNQIIEYNKSNIYSF